MATTKKGAATPSPQSTSADRLTKVLAQKPTDLPGWVYAKGGIPKAK